MMFFTTILHKLHVASLFKHSDHTFLCLVAMLLRVVLGRDGKTKRTGSKIQILFKFSFNDFTSNPSEAYEEDGLMYILFQYHWHLHYSIFHHT